MVEMILRFVVAPKMNQEPGIKKKKSSNGIDFCPGTFVFKSADLVTFVTAKTEYLIHGT